MLEVRSFRNELEILYSGHAHLHMNDKLKLVLGVRSIEISFRTEAELESKIDWVVENEVLKVVFQNLISLLGGGIITPWRIGDHDGRELFMTIYTQQITDKPKAQNVLCDYIFYLGKEVENG